MKEYVAPLALSIFAVAIPAHSQTPLYAFDDPIFDAVTADRLETFGSDRAFLRYIEQVEDLRRERRREAERRFRREHGLGAEPDEASRHNRAGVEFAALQDSETASDAAEDICTDPVMCDEDAGNIIVTGTRMASPPVSMSVSPVTSVSGETITNVQSVGVDEGDIVKQIGRFLLVLQDGRVFTVDTGQDRDGQLRLADRIDVYRSRSDAADWYDEMLVQGDRVIIAAYSYGEDATEITVLLMDRETGALSRDGVFFLTSDDYYSVDNYATRIIGDNLIVYTPYELDQLEEREDWPVVRRWMPEDEFDEARAEGRPLFEARDIYRPVQRTAEPWLHSVSICPLGSADDGGNLDCRTTAFVGPSGSEFFVSPENVFVWLWPVEDDVEDQIGYRLHRRVPDFWQRRREARQTLAESCNALPRAARRDVYPSVIYRIPVNGRQPGVIGINGSPFDQFSMDSREGEFRALVNWQRTACLESWERQPEVSFARFPLSSFGEELDVVRDRQITALPATGTRIVENRFADDYLVYGGRDSWSSRPPSGEVDPDDPKAHLLFARAITVPVRNPSEAVITQLPHNIVRTERVGNNMMLNGYRDESGLHMTLLELGPSPRIASTTFLSRRYESEGRSHAFNSLVRSDGSGMIGVPTVYRAEDSSRYWWRSSSSDVSFLTMATDLSLNHAGELEMSDEDPTHEDYRCEESCIDWYGNSRPIFTMNRIFGLMGIELVEGRLADGRIEEVQRLNLTVPVDGADD